MKLALGTAQFGLNYGIANRKGRVSTYEIRKILECAATHGIDTLDSAIAYGDCEQRLSEIGVQNWQIVSKLPSVPEGYGNVSQWVIESVQDSLQRLKVKSLYGLLLHKPEQLLGWRGEHIYHALQDLKHAGIVKKTGISIYSPVELDTFVKWYQFDIVQAPFNILDRRLIDSGWLSRLHEQDIELHVRSVFLQGLLLMMPSERPQQFGRFLSLWKQWDKWLAEIGLTPLEVCIRYALSFPEISKIIVGVDNLNQLREILQMSEGPSFKVPPKIFCNDIDLINPARWNTL